MSEDRRQRVESLFLAAIELPATQRDALLQAEPDEAVRREVLSLLAHAEESSTGAAGSNGFLDSKDAPGRALRTGIGGEAVAAAHVEEPPLPPGSVVGRYTLRGIVGVGGMGVVYIAEQDRPRRTVALKILRSAIASPRMLRRFEYEAEVLGRLHHPGIAQVFEAGAFVDGRMTRPYIAMELVRGLPLIEAVKRRALGPRQRLELLAKICDAMQHAHQVGVIHRDLKPANILVEDGSGDGHPAWPEAPATSSSSAAAALNRAAVSPKILDFGVARGLESDPTLSTVQTGVGQIIGTLPYMSPEQIEGDPTQVDIRCDIYALGVIGYELLVGRLPHDLSKRSLADAARILRDEAPPRLSSFDRTLRGDVETIIAAAMAKDPERRYQSAAELAADIRRHLAGEPIAARQDSAWYVLLSYVRRNKAVVAASVAGLLGVLGFSIWVAIQAEANAKLAVEASQQRDKAIYAQERALEQRTRADQTAARLAAELNLANLERGRLHGIAGNLDAAEELLWPEFLRSISSHHTYYSLWELYSNLPCLATLACHKREVRAVAVAPAGDLAATGGDDPSIVIFDAQNLAALRSIDAGETILSLAFNADAARLAGVDKAGGLRVWDVRTGELIHRLLDGAAPIDPNDDSPPPPSPQAFCIEYSPVDDVLYAGFRNGEIRAWSSDGAVIAQVRLGVQTDPVMAVKASADGARIAACTRSGRVRVYDAALASYRELSERTGQSVNTLAISPSGRCVALGVLSQVELWDVDATEMLARLESPAGGVRSLAWGRDEHTLHHLGWWLLLEWDTQSRTITRRYSNAWSDASMALSPRSSEIWLTTIGGVRVWDTSGRSALVAFPRVPGRTIVRHGPFGHTVAGDADGAVWLLDPKTGESLALLGKNGGRRIRAIAFSPTEPVAATSGIGSTLRLWNLQERRLIGEWPGVACVSYRSMAFAPSGDRLVTPMADGSFQVRRVPDGQAVLTIPSDKSEPLMACYSPDGALIATATRRNITSIYDAADGRLVAECESSGSPSWCLAFSPDGKNLVGGDWGRTITVWDARTGAAVRRLSGHTGLISDLAFRPFEPNILGSASSDGTIRFWDLSVGASTPILTLRPPAGWDLWTIDFHPARSEVITTDARGNVSMWRLRYYNRHILGNLPWQFERWRSRLPDMPPESDIRDLEATLRRGIREALGPASRPN